MLILSKDDIRKAFSMLQAIDAVEEAFVMHSKKEVEVPLRSNISVQKYDASLLFMPAYAPAMDIASLKIVAVYPHNKKLNLPVTPAQVLLIDAASGMVKAILDGTYVTALRTAAASGLALKLLADEDASIGAMIGSGGQAKLQLEAMLSVRKLKEVRVFSRDRAKLDEFLADVSKEYGHFAVEFIAADSAEAAVDGADMLITATNSKEALFDGSCAKKGLAVSAIGSYTKAMKELDSKLLQRASKIYYDDKDAMMAEAGEIVKALEEGVISEAKLEGSIGSLALGDIRGREDKDEILIFKSVGIGTQDLITAKAIYEIASDKGLGQKVECN